MKKITKTLSLVFLYTIVCTSANAENINKDSQFETDYYQTIDSLIGQSLNNYNWTQSNREEIDNQKQSLVALEKETGNQKQSLVALEKETGRISKKEESDFDRTINYSKEIDAKVERNTQSIADNSLSIQKNSKDIEELRHDFENMSKQLNGVEAMNMATSNLFQPYGVGKINISVGLGVYEDAHAIAFGSGVRLDEHFAVSSSVSFEDSTSHAAVGVGASYEW